MPFENCAKCTCKKTEVTRRHQVNKCLAIGIPTYTDGLPISTINSLLMAHEFNPMEPAIYCGESGNVHEQVGDKTWISLTWYKMESGKYEIVVYLS